MTPIFDAPPARSASAAAGEVALQVVGRDRADDRPEVGRVDAVGAGEEVGGDHPEALPGQALAEPDELGGHAVALVDDDDAGAGRRRVGGGDGECGEREFGHGRTLPRVRRVAPLDAVILEAHRCLLTNNPAT